jgi:hypothetical protein
MKTEGKIITPDWYVVGKVCKSEANLFSRSIDFLIHRVKDLYSQLIKDSVENKKPWLASMYITREQEYWTKVEYQLGAILQQRDVLTEDKRVNDTSWPLLENNVVVENIECRKLELIDPIKIVVAQLLFIKRPDEYPDFLGQFSHQFGEYCIESIVSNNDELFQKVFDIFFFCCYRQFEMIQPKGEVEKWQLEGHFMMAVAPLIDLMEMSGFAILCSEYFSNDNLRRVVENRWNDYLSEQAEPAKINAVSAVISCSDGFVGIPNRSQYRLNWKRRVESLLKGIPVEHSARGGIFNRETIVQHSSPLVRVFYPEDLMGFHYEGVSIFITDQLIKREDADGLAFGRKHRDLTDSIKREEDRYQRYMEEKE